MRRLVTLAVLTAIATLAVAGTASAAGVPGALTLTPDSVRDGASSQGTMTLAFPDNPIAIQVRSNLGGAASATLNR